MDARWFFLIWLIIFGMYIAGVRILSTPTVESVVGTIYQNADDVGGEKIGISHAMTVQVIRSPQKFLFLELPSYVLGYNIKAINTAFMWVMEMFLLIIFVAFLASNIER